MGTTGNIPRPVNGIIYANEFGMSHESKESLH